VFFAVIHILLALMFISDAALLKVKLFLYLTKYHALKTYWRSGDTATRILDLGNWMEVSGQLHAPEALPTRKEPPIPIG